MKADLRDLHIYGGIVLAGIGIGFIYWQAALIAVGASLAYLGVWRLGRLS